MQFVVALLKKLPIVPIALFIVGVVLGLFIGWGTKEFKDATPFYLRPDLREDYLRMTIDSFRLNQNPNLAVQRWQGLGSTAQEAYTNIQNNPGDQDPAVIQAYGQLVTEVLSSGGGQPASDPTATGMSPIMRTALIGVGIILVLGVAAAGGMYLFRLFGKRGSGEVTVVMQAAEISRSAAKTNFEDMGLAPPITQTMTTYVLVTIYTMSLSASIRGRVNF
ncbi:MAG: hypothetical protein HYU84_05430 [Chloroflexi bacterium]|nr:hypothetical protein [Chloroflexota bacterium]